MITKAHGTLLLILIFFLGSCGLGHSDDPGDSIPLELLNIYDLDFNEPSGLCFSEELQTLYCVNDPPSNRIYEVSTTGQVLNNYAYRGSDLEGIALGANTGSFWLAEEGDADLILTNGSQEQARIELELTLDDPNRGIEGVYHDPDSREFIVVVESDPPQIILADSTGRTIEHFQANFASDLSGITFSGTPGEYLLLSHRDMACYLWSTSEGLLKTFAFDINQAEGIALDRQGGRLYIVCDAEARLYVYRGPGALL